MRTTNIDQKSGTCLTYLDINPFVGGNLSISVFYIIGKLKIKMATKVYSSHHQYLRKNPKLNALFYYFPEAALISTYTTEILISHCLNIVTDRCNTNSDRLSQF